MYQGPTPTPGLPEKAPFVAFLARARDEPDLAPYVFPTTMKARGPHLLVIDFMGDPGRT